MSWSYRLNQVLNTFKKRKVKKPVRWGLIYGLPRSGTTFLLQAFMHQSRAGIGDWDLRELQSAIRYYERSSYITLDTASLKEDILRNIIQNAPPGGGGEYDMIVKQIDTNMEEYDFLVEIFASEPAFKLFCYREPNGWLPSAQKKFNIDETAAMALYKRSLESFKAIGGDVIEYDQIAQITVTLKKFHLSVTGFDPGKNLHKQVPDPFRKLYDDFKARLS